VVYDAAWGLPEAPRAALPGLANLMDA